jgi:uncharacterized protein YajQ (UPF0234 family)
MSTQRTGLAWDLAAARSSRPLIRRRTLFTIVHLIIDKAKTQKENLALGKSSAPMGKIYTPHPPAGPLDFDLPKQPLYKQPMASFDIVSEVDLQEIDNAVNQARKQILNRFDFKGSKSEFQWDRKSLTIMADDDYKLGAMKDILQGKVHHRGIDMRALRFEDPTPASGNMLRQSVTIMEGIDKESAKKLVKQIKDMKLKVQPAIQEDKVRVSSKSIDTLRECMDKIKALNFAQPLQFINFR